MSSTTCWRLVRSRKAATILLTLIVQFGDRLLSAVGQDIFECLFAAEVLERGPDGRSQILRPLGFLALALVYNG